MSSEIFVTRSSMPPFEEYCEEIKDIWESRWLTNRGKKHQELTEKLEKKLGVDHVQLTVNGHYALELVFQAMGLTGEVITTPFTFVSTTHALVRSGLTPVFADIDPDNYTMDPEKIEALITPKTSAIVPVHVYGNVCDVKAIEDIAKKHGLKVIYDAAHAFNETYDGKSVATYGDASIFSFHATKVFNTIEGGAVCCDDAELSDKMDRMKDFGIRDEECVDCIGGNGKMNEFAAAMGLCNLRHLDEEIGKRKRVYDRYMERLDGVKGLKLVKTDPLVQYNYAYFPVVFEDSFGMGRDQVFDRLNKEGIHARKYFYPCTNALDCYKDRYDPNDTPVALDISKRVMTLPFYASLELKDVDRICDVILEVGKN
ncbi:MAG: DegT/DnrJ/EryC1/StrS family aminotransferase [Lachnospiraceae bacterium]|nr:DegT/DnrJ/EryC1/StrS family aminotransferase [Lachnospiraceae bacterium]